MELRANLKTLTRDIHGGKFLATFELDELSGLEQVSGPLRISVVKWRNKRTLTANAYYWLLVGRLAKVLRISNSRCHNILMRRYGQPEMMNGQIVCMMLKDTETTDDEVLEKDTYHLMPTSKLTSGKDGMYRLYKMLKGSHDMNSEEFGRLLDGTIDECKGCGIEVLPPEEIEAMMRSYEESYGKQKNVQ